MSEQVTLELSDDVYRFAAWWAERNGKPIEEVLTETIELSLLPLGEMATDPIKPEDWDDEAVLAAVDAELSDDEERRITILLNRQQAGTITKLESGELIRLMQTYQSILLRKSEGLREAVRRGLRPAPPP